MKKQIDVDELKKRIDAEYEWLMQTEHTLYDVDIALSSIKHYIDYVCKNNNSDKF